MDGRKVEQNRTALRTITFWPSDGPSNGLLITLNGESLELSTPSGRAVHSPFEGQTMDGNGTYSSTQEVTEKNMSLLAEGLNLMLRKKKTRIEI